jgi:hypothetical protein
MKYKKCNTCGITKPIKDYYLTGRFTKDGKNIPRAKCKSCVEDVKRKRRDATRKFVNDYKAERGCERCGYSKETHKNFTPKALEFHHPRDDKEFAIGDAANKGKSIKSIKNEIIKCVLLCARCHAEIHHGNEI